MAFTRALVSWGAPDAKPEDRFSNTLYFNVSGSVDDPDYQALANDLRTIYVGQTFCAGSLVQVRFYDMADEKPRPERAFAQGQATGTRPSCAGQVAVALSYYADRNLPRRRGRIFTGPYANTSNNIVVGIRTNLIAFGQALGGLGGVNVDWSVYSPTTAISGDDGHWRISNIWVDDSWDVIRSRKYRSTARSTATING